MTLSDFPEPLVEGTTSGGNWRLIARLKFRHVPFTFGKYPKLLPT